MWLLELVKHATENKDMGSWDIGQKKMKESMKRSMNVTLHKIVLPIYMEHLK